SWRSRAWLGTRRAVRPPCHESYPLGPATGPLGRRSWARGQLGLSVVPAPVRPEQSVARVCPRHLGRGVLLDRPAPRAAHLRGGDGPSRDARAGAHRTGVGRHLPEAVAWLRRTAAEAAL